MKAIIESHTDLLQVAELFYLRMEQDGSEKSVVGQETKRIIDNAEKVQNNHILANKMIKFLAEQGYTLDEMPPIFRMARNKFEAYKKEKTTSANVAETEV